MTKRCSTSGHNRESGDGRDLGSGAWLCRGRAEKNSWNFNKSWSKRVSRRVVVVVEVESEWYFCEKVIVEKKNAIEVFEKLR